MSPQRFPAQVSGVQARPFALRDTRWVSFFIAILVICVGLLAAPGMVRAAPPAPLTDLRAQRSGTSVILRWTHSDVTAHHYEVWWSDSPYAAPGDAGMVMIATVTPGAAPSEATYTDTASGVGNTAVNSFYAVRGVTAGGEVSPLSNRAGEFDFGLNGTTPTLPVVDHCGTIGADEVWGPNAVHQVTCSVTVNSTAKLTIVAGTQIRALSSVALNIYGIGHKLSETGGCQVCHRSVLRAG